MANGSETGDGRSSAHPAEIFETPKRVKEGTAEKTWFQLRKNMYTKQDELASAKESGEDPTKVENLEKKFKNTEKQFQILELVQGIHEQRLVTQAGSQIEGSQPKLDPKDLSALGAANILEEQRIKWEEKLKTTTDPQERINLENSLNAAWDLDGMLIQESLRTANESQEYSAEKPVELTQEKITAGTASAVNYRLERTIKGQQVSRLQAKVEGKDTQGIEAKIDFLERQKSLLESIRVEHQIRAENLNSDDVEIPLGEIPADTAADILIKVFVPAVNELVNEYAGDPQKLADLKITQQAISHLDDWLVDESQRVPKELSSQAPKTLETPSQKRSEDDTAALEKRAGELAIVTRAIGKGQLHGFVYPIDRTAGMGSVRGMGFSQGKSIEGNPEGYKTLEQELRPKLPHRDINDSRWNEQRQVWMVGEQNGQTRYTYYMPTETTWDTRPGIMVEMNVSLPNNVALQIDQMVEKDPRFPDMYFKALFPGVVGEDSTNKIRRKEAIDLAIVDARKHPGYEAAPELINSAEIKPYPIPIPY